MAGWELVDQLFSHMFLWAFPSLSWPGDRRGPDHLWDTLLGRYKNLIVLAAILFAQIIALAIQVKRPAQEGETRLIRVWVIAAVTPFEKAIIDTQTWARDQWTGYVFCAMCAVKTSDCATKSST